MQLPGQKALNISDVKTLTRYNFFLKEKIPVTKSLRSFVRAGVVWRAVGPLRSPLCTSLVCCAGTLAVALWIRQKYLLQVFHLSPNLQQSASSFSDITRQPGSMFHGIC